MRRRGVGLVTRGWHGGCASLLAAILTSCFPRGCAYEHARIGLAWLKIQAL